jgi:uncharacterized repeat protein (TIGR01451 family)
MPGACPGGPADAAICCPPGQNQAIPLPSACADSWCPPALECHHPDEYLCDGGDQIPHARVGAEWEIRGLNLEDTVGHFDTVDGRTVVVPSNRVCIYSPKFGAVRQVVSLRQNEQRNPWAGVHQPLKPVRYDDLEVAASSKQNFQPEGQVGRSRLTGFHTRQGDGAMSSVNGPIAFQDRLLPYEAPLAIGQGIVDASEMAWLADGVHAALAWSQTEGLEVMIDRTRASVETADQEVETVYTVQEPPGHPKLRVIKVASTQYAQPGETIDFTIRFDNVGNQVIGNVTLVDNLTTRLEYVPDSAQCSVPAEFFTEPNEGDSLVLRWEITDPLEPGKGGVIRFRCRVR